MDALMKCVLGVTVSAAEVASGKANKDAGKPSPGGLPLYRKEDLVDAKRGMHAWKAAVKTRWQEWGRIVSAGGPSNRQDWVPAFSAGKQVRGAMARTGNVPKSHSDNVLDWRAGCRRFRKVGVGRGNESELAERQGDTT